MTKTCTVVIHADGERCGRPGVYSFTASTGERFTECADHYEGPVVPTRVEPKLGDEVDVHRHGKVYTGTVVRVGARGAVYAEVTYNNGATRTVRADRHARVERRAVRVCFNGFPGLSQTVIPMPSTRIEAGRYVVLGTTREVIAERAADGGWFLRLSETSFIGPFATKRAALQYCQEHPEL